MPLNISSLKLIKISQNSFLDIVNIPPELIISKLHLTYIDQQQDYSIHHSNFTKETNSCQAAMKVNLPIVVSASEAQRICFLALANADNEKSVIRFKLPITEINIVPTDFIIIEFRQLEYQIRIIATKIKGLSTEYTGIIDDITTYHRSPAKQEVANVIYKQPVETELAILDLPIKLSNVNYPYLSAYLNSDIRQKLFFRLESDISGTWHEIAYLTPSNAIAKVIAFDQPAKANFFVVDKTSRIIITGHNLESHILDDWQWALVGKEIIRFKNLQKINDDIYEVTMLTRGEGATAPFIGQHHPEEQFIFLQKGQNIIEVSKDIIGQPLVLRVRGNITQHFTFNNNNSKPLPAFITENRVEDNKLKLKWIARSFGLDSWHFNPTLQNIEYLIKITCHDIVSEFSSKETYLEIDLSTLALSEGFKVDIISIVA